MIMKTFVASYIGCFVEQICELGFKRKVCICQHVVKVGINVIILTGLRLVNSFHLKMRVYISIVIRILNFTHKVLHFVSL